MQVTVEPGDPASMHWHPHNYTVVLAPAKLHMENKNGTSLDINLIESQVRPSPTEGLHAVKNIGTTTFRAIQTEFKT